MHVSFDSDCTADPSQSFPSQYWPFRTTLLSRGGRRYEVFESGEYWADRKFISTFEPKTKIVTFLSLEPVDPGSIGKVVVPNPFQLGDRAAPMEVEPEQVEGGGPSGHEEGGPSLVEEQPPVPVQRQATLVINGVELTEESTLKLLRNACKFLRVSPHGSKAVLWGRLQSEIADSQIKASVQASDAVLEAYRREPHVEKTHEQPDAETIAMHEVTHCPRMPWCSACTAMRSREDNHGSSTPKEGGVIHLDFMFTKTEIPGEVEDPLACHMVVVDEQTNFTSCIPVEGKATEHLKSAVDEVVKLAAALEHNHLTIRGDSEPSIKSFLQAVSAARTRLGVATKVELAPPDSKLHHGLKAERFIGIVRDLGNTLLATIKEHTGFSVRSGHPVFQWAFRHSAFLYTRFHVQQSGQTAFELVHGRSYTGKLCPFGGAVFAQLLPVTPAKGNGWTKGIFLGKSTLVNLNIVGTNTGVHYARTMRRGPLSFETELIASTRGVPWNATLDVIPVKRKRAPKFRAPILVEPEESTKGEEKKKDPGPDEAGSDPSNSVSLPGESVAGYSPSPMSGASSAEMVPDAEMVQSQGVNQLISPADEVQDMFARIVQVEYVTGHEEEVIPAVELDMSEFESGDFVVEPEIPKVAKPSSADVVPWAYRTYEDGPPELSQEELEKLDTAMDRVEDQRLLQMGVLRRMDSSSARPDMKKLQSKYVRDWRFRGGCWIRRSRLVAKEFRFLEPELQNLYAPASMAVLQRVFAGLCVSGENLVLYSVDVSDAYLMVPQEQPTFIVTNDGEAMELLFNLPGQRSGARGWYMHLKDVMDKGGLKAFAGAPAVFYETGKIACNSHVDDLQIVGGEKRGDDLLKDMKKSGLKIQIEGPVTIDGGQCRFLKRLFQGDGTGIVVIPEQKYVEKLCSLLGLQKASPKPTPLPSSLVRPSADAELVGEEYNVYRSALGLLLYMSSDYPELHFGVRMLGSRCSAPTAYDMQLMRHVAKYLKGRENFVLKLSQTIPGTSFEERLRNFGEVDVELNVGREASFGKGHLLECITDADWASSHFSRKSVSSYSLYLNGNCVYVSTRLQQSLSLSSCEAEYMSSLQGCCDGLFVKALLEEITGSPVKLVHRTDNSAARAIIGKQGSGRLRHVDLAYLWLQLVASKGLVIEKPIGTKYCPPDLGTKNHSRKRQQLLLGLLGFVSLDSGLLAGQDQIHEMIVVSGFKKSFPSANALRAVISMLMVQPSNGLLIGNIFYVESTMVSFMWGVMGIFVCVMVLMMLMAVVKSRFVKFGVVVGALVWGVIPTMGMEPEPEPSEHREDGQDVYEYQLPNIDESETHGQLPVVGSSVEHDVEGSDPTAASSTGPAAGTSSGHQGPLVPDSHLGDDGLAAGTYDEEYVFRLGQGGSYHRFGCGMTRRFWKDHPLRVRRLSRSFAQTETYLKPCKQCNPDS